MTILPISKFLFPKGGAETVTLATGELLRGHGHEGGMRNVFAAGTCTEFAFEFGTCPRKPRTEEELIREMERERLFINMAKQGK